MIEPTIIPEYERERASKARVKELRDELDALGYHVIRKDWVRKIGVQQVMSPQDLYRDDETVARIAQHMRRSMGASLGVHILESGAMQFGHEDVVDVGRIYRGSTSIILRDPQFDKPAWLK